MSSPTEPAASLARGEEQIRQHRGSGEGQNKGSQKRPGFFSLLVPVLQWDPSAGTAAPGELWSMGAFGAGSWEELGCPPAAAHAPPSRGAATLSAGEVFANISREVWESSSSSREEGHAQSEVLTSDFAPLCCVRVLLCDLHRPLPEPPQARCSQPRLGAGRSPSHLCRGLCFGDLTRCLIRSFLSHGGTAAFSAYQPQFTLMVIEPRSLFSPNQREERKIIR